MKQRGNRDETVLTVQSLRIHSSKQYRLVSSDFTIENNIRIRIILSLFASKRLLPFDYVHFSYNRTWHLNTQHTYCWVVSQKHKPRPQNQKPQTKTHTHTHKKKTSIPTKTETSVWSIRNNTLSFDMVSFPKLEGLVITVRHAKRTVHHKDKLELSSTTVSDSYSLTSSEWCDTTEQKHNIENWQHDWHGNNDDNNNGQEEETISSIESYSSYSSYYSSSSSSSYSESENKESVAILESPSSTASSSEYTLSDTADDETVPSSSRSSSSSSSIDVGDKSIDKTTLSSLEDQEFNQENGRARQYPRSYRTIDWLTRRNFPQNSTINVDGSQSLDPIVACTAASERVISETSTIDTDGISEPAITNEPSQQRDYWYAIFNQQETITTDDSNTSPVRPVWKKPSGRRSQTLNKTFVKKEQTKEGTLPKVGVHPRGRDDRINPDSWRVDRTSKKVSVREKYEKVVDVDLHKGRVSPRYKNMADSDNGSTLCLGEIDMNDQSPLRSAALKRGFTRSSDKAEERKNKGWDRSSSEGTDLASYNYEVNTKKKTPVAATTSATSQSLEAILTNYSSSYLAYM